ncbi:sporulation protein [Rufibacter sp. LB8]|uniref:sporulation protein n=1 Tax=Rufibacter sp. LB8 TaxID=2777781 RepID=UPI00178C50E1|nr:sporulation protein [Rufibacter sp. LB8]
MMKRFLGILVAVSMMGCAATSSSTSTGNGSTTANTGTRPAADTKGGAAVLVDTRKYLTKFPAATASNTASVAPAAPSNHVKNQVTLLMDSVAVVQKNIRYAAGYRILAYTGIERKAAMDLRNSLVQRLPEQRDYLTFKQPTYQLKFGDFFTRVEAQAALAKIRDLLPNALLVQETINIPK